MEVREKLSKLVAFTRRMVEGLRASFGWIYFSFVMFISVLPAAVALTVAWNYAIVGMFTFTASVAFLEMLVLLACVWVIVSLYLFIQAYNRLRFFKWQTQRVQEVMGQQTQAEAGLMKHFNRGNHN